MDYFYCPPDSITNDSLFIEGEEFTHLVHVMRKKKGDEVRVVDGRGTAYDVRLRAIKEKTARGEIQRRYENHHEPAIDVTLGVAVLKNPSKFDFLVEKVTELGVREIVPLKTGRTIPHHAKVDRWQKLALAAMKQCGRAYLPRVQAFTTLDDFLASNRGFDLKVIVHNAGTGPADSAKRLAASYRSVVILVGPEGGFSEEEVARCTTAGYVPVSLGERRLRTETAAIVALALVMR